MAGESDFEGNGPCGAFGEIWPVQPIDWATQPGDEPASPFHPDSSRPIRLTLHTESLDSLCSKEADALAALLDLAHLKDIEMLETGVGQFPRIIVQPDRVGDLYPVFVRYPNGHELEAGITVEDEASRIPFREASIVLAHGALGNDLFVTAHPWILRNATRFFVFRNAALMPPSAAARMVGLLLRGRERYNVRGNLVYQGGYLFYLMRFVLAGLWRYFGACVETGEWGEGAPGSLGSAIMIRAERALEARDAIGVEYYGGGPGATRRIEYHFDYLMLLLNGILDAQARIAFLVYGLSAPKSKSKRNFRDGQFRKELRDANGGALVKIVEGNEALLNVVAALRNTIHGSSLHGMRVNRTAPEALYLEVPTSVVEQFITLTKATPWRQWGLRDEKTRPLFSPFIFADAAVREVFRVVNEIAVVTNVESLVVDPVSRSRLRAGPPEGNELFSEDIGRRLIALGW